MKVILGNYESFISSADTLLKSSGIDRSDIVQCDTVCYRVETNERYDELKLQLASCALMVSESEVNGRDIAVYSLEEPLVVGDWSSISFIELPQPKPDNKYIEGIDHVQFVTRQGLAVFRSKYSGIRFDEKGLANKLNPLLKLEADGVALKLHDKHMGAVIELEQAGEIN